MNIFEKLKDWIFKLRGTPIKTLPEKAQVDSSTNLSNMQASRKQFSTALSTFEKDLLASPHSIEFAIDQYMKSIFHSYTLHENLSSYHATTSLGSLTSEVSNGNKAYQTSLICKLKNDSNYAIQFQPDSSVEPNFYHIRKSQYSPDSTSQLRLYLNLKRENISKFSHTFIKEMGNDPFYFKMASDKHISLCPRSEAIVIYTDKKDLSKVVNKLRKIKQQHPELLKDAEHGNPFLEKIDGFIRIAPEPPTDTYITQKGTIQKIPKSFNSFLSAALQESFVSSAKEIIARDRDLTLKTNGVIDDDFKRYVSLYPVLIQRHYQDLVGSIKYALMDSVRRNPFLTIKGIPKPSQDLSHYKD